MFGNTKYERQSWFYLKFYVFQNFTEKYKNYLQNDKILLLRKH